MNYEIMDIQTVSVSLDDNSIGKEITTLTVGYEWDNKRTIAKIEVQGRPTDDEVLSEISKTAQTILLRNQTPVGESLVKRGTLTL